MKLKLLVPKLSKKDAILRYSPIVFAALGTALIDISSIRSARLFFRGIINNCPSPNASDGFPNNYYIPSGYQSTPHQLLGILFITFGILATLLLLGSFKFHSSKYKAITLIVLLVILVSEAYIFYTVDLPGQCVFRG